MKSLTKFFEIDIKLAYLVKRRENILLILQKHLEIQYNSVITNRSFVKARLQNNKFRMFDLFCR